MVSVSNILSSSDPGDDMQRRIRYQAAYGALVCLDLVAGDTIVEIFCEHHEDLLLHLLSSKYLGVQVKTREIHLGPFKSNEEAIVSSLAKFVSLDIEFPEQFEGFRIAANCDFWQVEENEKNLAYVLKLLRRNPNAKLAGTMKGVIDDIRQRCGCTKKAVLKTLGKTELLGMIPKFEDITVNIAAGIGRMEQFSGREFAELCSSAESLINKVLDASALTCDQPLRTHFLYASAPSEEIAKAAIEKKRLTKATVLAAIESSLASAIELHAANKLDITKLPMGHHRLEKKMAAGDISFASIDVAKDHQVSADYLLQQWLHRLGPEKANRRYEQIEVLVRTQCAEAYDEVESESTFGKKMLSRVRRRLKGLALKDANAVFGARYEHLLGVASIATQECKVWWSKKFILEEE
jgi:hypothetical protein